MATRITYEHPPGSSQTGCQRTFADDYVLPSNRGDLRADEVQVGDCLKTTPKHKTKVLAVEALEE